MDKKYFRRLASKQINKKEDRPPDPLWKTLLYWIAILTVIAIIVIRYQFSI